MKKKYESIYNGQRAASMQAVLTEDGWHYESKSGVRLSCSYPTQAEAYQNALDIARTRGRVA